MEDIIVYWIYFLLIYYPFFNFDYCDLCKINGNLLKHKIAKLFTYTWIRTDYTPYPEQAWYPYTTES